MTGEEIKTLLHYVPLAMRSSSVTDWERTFLISVAARMKGGAFWPSEKQLPILDRIVTKFRDVTLRDVIEDDRGRD